MDVSMAVCVVVNTTKKNATTQRKKARKVQHVLEESRQNDIFNSDKRERKKGRLGWQAIDIPPRNPSDSGWKSNGGISGGNESTHSALSAH